MRGYSSSAERGSLCEGLARFGSMRQISIGPLAIEGMIVRDASQD